MRKLLIVDDDPVALATLGKNLAPLKNNWQMTMSLGTQAAAAELARSPVDAVFAAASPPGVAGPHVLMLTREKYPEAVRILLVDGPEQRSQMALAENAHLCLPKSCSAPVASDAVERALGLRLLVDDPALRKVMSSTGKLPVRAHTWSRLNALLESEKASLRDVSRVVEEDPALAAKVLQLVNSAYFGLASRVTTISQGVSYLGTEHLKTLILSIEMVRGLGEAPRQMRDYLEEVQQRSLALARVARALLVGSPDAEVAFTAGVLVDIGSLVLATRLPMEYGEILKEAEEGLRSLPAIERSVLGATHCQLGAYLLGIWGLPLPVVDAVNLHHSGPANQELSVATAVAIADAIVTEQLAPPDRRAKHRDATDKIYGAEVFVARIAHARTVMQRL